MGLACEAIASQPLLKTELHKDAEAHLLAMKHGVAAGQQGEAVVHGVGSNGPAAGTAQATDHSGREPTGFSRAYPGGTGLVLQGLMPIDHQLVSEHPGHLNGLLHKSITAVTTADGGFVPLRQCIGDATGQRAGWSVANQIMVKHQKVRTVLQSHIAPKGTLR